MNLAIRIVWFAFVGWWLGVLWFFLSCLLALTVIWYNVGLFMVINTWRMMTLESSPQEILDDVWQIR